MNCSSLKEIRVPDTVTDIFVGAFEGCSAVETLIVPFVGSSRDSAGCFGYIFGGTNYGNQADYVPGTLKTVIVTGGSNIAKRAFADCSSIEAPDASRGACPNRRKDFFGAYRLSSITVAEGNPTYHSSGNCSIASYAFNNFKNIVNFIADRAVQEVRKFDFIICTSLKYVWFYLGLRKLVDSVFYDCKALREVYLPDNLVSRSMMIIFLNLQEWFYTSTRILLYTISQN